MSQQEKNTPEKNFSPREEDERLRGLSMMCIEQVLEVPYAVTELSILKLIKKIEDAITYSANDDFSLLFSKFLEEINSNLGTAESREFTVYCYLSPITMFLFETQVVAVVKKRFNALKNQILQDLQKVFMEKRYNNLLQFYRLVLLYSCIAERKNLSEISTIKADFTLLRSISGINQNEVQYGMEQILVAFDSWNESTRLP